jgi:hypothetical protein
MPTLTVPGPSPWYLRAPSARISADECDWTWETDAAQLSHLSRLLSPNGETMMLLDLYCYVQPLANARLLIWHEVAKRDAPRHPRIVFALIDLRTLEVLDDPPATAKSVKASRERVYFRGGNAVSCEFATTLDAGLHPISSPAPFHELPETLALADFGGGGQSSNHFDRMYRAIFAFDFRSGQVAVIPQHWFNEGSYDFGYQWIVRVQREAASGRIFGEGIRLGAFRLNEAGTHVEEWSPRDDFYHPEGSAR